MDQRFNEELYWSQKYLNCEKTRLKLSAPHSSLAEYISFVAPEPSSFNSKCATIFIPFCGRSLDMAYLISAGYYVVGCEKNEEIVQQIFTDIEAEPEVKEAIGTNGHVKVYQFRKLKIYVCDFFNLPKLPDVDGCFDKAVLVRLPPEQRKKYCVKMDRITNTAPQLLIAYEHARYGAHVDSLPEQLLNQLYGQCYNVESLSRRMSDSDPSIIEVCYLLTKRTDIDM